MVGFAAMSWSALSGVAHAFDGTAPATPVAQAQAATAQDATAAGSPAVAPRLTQALAGATHLLDALPISVPDAGPDGRPTEPDSPAPSAPSDAHTESVGQDLATPAPAPHRLPDVVGDLVSGVDTVVNQVAPATTSRPADTTADTTAGTTADAGSAPRFPDLLTTVHDTVRGTVRTTVDGVAATAGTAVRTTTAAVGSTAGVVGSTLTATPDDPSGSVLTGVLNSLGVDKVLPTDALGALPLPTLPLVNEPVGVVQPLLPAPTGQSGSTPGSGGHPGPGEQAGAGEQPGGQDQTGASAPAPVSTPAAPIFVAGEDAADPAQASVGDAAAGELALPVPATRAGGTLLPTLLGDGSAATTGTGSEVPVEHAGGVRDPLLSSLLALPHDGQSDDDALPIPTGPSAPGGHGGGSTDGGQAGNGLIETFRLPDIRPAGLARAEAWGLSAAPTFDPGFSPD